MPSIATRYVTGDDKLKIYTGRDHARDNKVLDLAYQQRDGVLTPGTLADNAEWTTFLPIQPACRYVTTGTSRSCSITRRTQYAEHDVSE